MSREENGPELPPEILRDHIAGFIGPIESSQVGNELFSQASETDAQALLDRIVQEHCVDPDYPLRLGRAVLDYYESFYFSGGEDHAGIIRPPNPTIPARLLWQCRKKVHLAHREMEPMWSSIISVALPDKNLIVFLELNASTFRIFDTTRMEVVVEVPTGLPHGMPQLQAMKRLYFSDGHLVLYHENRRPSIYLWRLQEQEQPVLQYKGKRNLRDEHSPVEDGVAVSKDGVLYLLCSVQKQIGTDLTVSYGIAAYQISTGYYLGQSTTLQMPQPPAGANLPMRTVDTLLVSGNHLLFIRHMEEEEEEGPFPNIGLGVYSYARNGLSLQCFLPCFEDGEYSMNQMNPRGPFNRHETSNKWIFYRHADEDHHRKLLIGDDGSITLDPGTMPWTFDFEVLLLTASRAIVWLPFEEGDICLYEYDSTTGENLRVMNTKLAWRVHSIDVVFSNGRELFCVLWSVDTRTMLRRNCIQSFIL